jgi:hypothetical protein
MDKPPDADETTQPISESRMRAAAAFAALIAVAGAMGACHRNAEPGGQPKVASAPHAPVSPAPPAAPAIEGPSGFHHEAGFTATGYLMPASAVRVANLQLTNVSLGSASDFSEWEGGHRASEFGPVMLEFSDPASANGEPGGAHTLNVRVLPTAYNVDSHTLSFAGENPNLGHIVLNARFDPDALHRALNSGGETTQTPVAHGELLIGDRRFENVDFTYFAGD